MPTQDQHLAKAEENEAAFHLLRGLARHPGWQATMLFYAALQTVDAYLHAAGVLPPGTHRRSHRYRIQLVQLHLGLSMRADLVELQQTSEDVRYDVRGLTGAEVDGLFSGPFTRIRTVVRTSLDRQT